MLVPPRRLPLLFRHDVESLELPNRRQHGLQDECPHRAPPVSKICSLCFAKKMHHRDDDDVQREVIVVQRELGYRFFNRSPQECSVVCFAGRPHCIYHWSSILHDVCPQLLK